MSKLNEYAIDYDAKLKDLESGQVTVIPARVSIHDALTMAYEYNMTWFERIQDVKEEEDQLLDQVKQKFDEEVKAGKIPEELQANELRKRLRRAADSIDWPPADPKNLILIGAPGVGKTSIVRNWCRKNQVGFVDVKGGQIQPGVMGGFPSPGPRMRPKKDKDGNIKGEEAVRFLPTEFFDELDDDTYDENILFLDELNRSDVSSEADILSLVLDHVTPDREETEKKGKRLYKRYLFTVAAINPPESEVDEAVRELSQAMTDRFFTKYCPADKAEFKEHIVSELELIQSIDEKAASRHPDNARKQSKAKLTAAEVKLKKQIVEYLCSPKNLDFQFYDPKAAGGDIKSPYGKGNSKNTINYRDLKTAILACNGTIGLPAKNSENSNYAPGSFMDEFQQGCTQDPAKLAAVERILRPLQEKINTERQMSIDPSRVTVGALYKLWKDQYLKQD